MKKLSELMQLKVDVSNQTIFRIFAVALLFAVGVQFVLTTRTALLLIFVSFFLAMALSPAVNFLSKYMPKKSRGLATASTYILALSLIGILISSIVPPIVSQTRQLIDSFPGYIEQLQESDGVIGSVVDYYDVDTGGDEIGEQVLARISGSGEPVLNFLERIFSNIVSTLTILVLTFFMLVEGPRWLNRFWRLQPKVNRKHRKELADRMYGVVTSYVNGQLLIASINGVVTLIVLSILGVPFAFSLASISALLGLIPVIGTTIGAVVVITVGLFQSLTIGITLLVYFVVYQQIENNAIQPAIQSRSLGMSPLLILVSVVIGINLAGILGGLLAIPIVGSLRILALDYIERNHLAHA